MAMANETLKEEREMREERHSGAMTYVIVWAALMVGTVITVWTGRMDLGALNLPLALTIATVKGTLVVLFFMHLAEHQGANRLVFGVSLLFVLLMLLFPLMDLGTRFRAALPSGTTAPEWQLGPQRQQPRHGGGLDVPEPGKP